MYKLQFQKVSKSWLNMTSDFQPILKYIILQSILIITTSNFDNKCLLAGHGKGCVYKVAHTKLHGFQGADLVATAAELI